MIDGIETKKKKFTDEVNRITTVFCDVLKVDSVSPNDNFFKLGGDSFDAIRVVSRLGGNLQIVSLFENPTVEDLAKYVLSKTNKRSVRLTPLHDKSSSSGSIVVIGVPFGGGDPTVYKDLFRESQGVRVFGVDFGDLEIKSASDFSILISTLADEIEEIDANQFIIYGHCAGAAVAACLASVMSSTITSLSLVVAASNPMSDPDIAIYESEKTSDYTWGQYLRSLGAFTGLIDKEIDEMLIRGRKDHLIAAEAYKTLIQHPVRGVPALVLLGDSDPATPQLSNIVEKWKNFIDVVDSTSLVGGGHYFVRTHAREVADTVLSFATRNRTIK
ncbi:acyl carrier protein [Xenorhabdus sp. 12]|uniref:Acyl carrier protein n=1 Tax=Xenorhabdus santafensis TaxID=2582833 RepID=A0ABU4SDL8_9GAMM|nr:alpha/beta fold hydrolase [Xenorhabdus sp. 12]MDX7988910.1 acyl carrier protein [Xenorhabdus sp. 12]